MSRVLCRVIENLLEDRSYEGNAERVRALVAATREALTTPVGLGPWERFELEYAERAVAVNFLTLALVSARKALVVSRLPRLEYKRGFNPGRVAARRSRGSTRGTVAQPARRKRAYLDTEEIGGRKRLPMGFEECRPAGARSALVE